MDASAKMSLQEKIKTMESLTEIMKLLVEKTTKGSCNEQDCDDEDYCDDEDCPSNKMIKYMKTQSFKDYQDFVKWCFGEEFDLSEALEVKKAKKLWMKLHPKNPLKEEWDMPCNMSTLMLITHLQTKLYIESQND